MSGPTILQSEFDMAMAHGMSHNKGCMAPWFDMMRVFGAESLLTNLHEVLNIMMKLWVLNHKFLEVTQPLRSAWRKPELHMAICMNENMH